MYDKLAREIFAGNTKKIIATLYALTFAEVVIVSAFLNCSDLGIGLACMTFSFVFLIVSKQIRKVIKGGSDIAQANHHFLLVYKYGLLVMFAGGFGFGFIFTVLAIFAPLFLEYLIRSLF